MGAGRWIGKSGSKIFWVYDLLRVLQTSTHSVDPKRPYSSPPQLHRTIDRRGLHPKKKRKKILQTIFIEKKTYIWAIQEQIVAYNIKK